MTDVYIGSAKLTPVGQLNGILDSLLAAELYSTVIICGDAELIRVQT